jgi:hypothetical protein
VVTYAFGDLFLRVAEHVVRCVEDTLTPSLLVIFLGIRVLVPVYIHNGHFELLYLTAGYCYHKDVQTSRSEEQWEAHGCHEELPTVNSDTAKWQTSYNG